MVSPPNSAARSETSHAIQSAWSIGTGAQRSPTQLYGAPLTARRTRCFEAGYVLLVGGREDRLAGRTDTATNPPAEVPGWTLEVPPARAANCLGCAVPLAPDFNSADRRHAIRVSGARFGAGAISQRDAATAGTARPGAEGLTGLAWRRTCRCACRHAVYRRRRPHRPSSDSPELYRLPSGHTTGRCLFPFCHLAPPSLSVCFLTAV